MIRVLIVEDDPMVAEINKRYLDSIPGFVCAGIVSDVSEAWAFLETHPVELVLLDIYMPGKNGLELLTEIRKEGKSIDVIVISAANDIPSIKKALRLGAVDYLIKPFEFERLNAALKIYRTEHEIMKEQEELSQEELDQLLLHPNKTGADHRQLPKGLTQETLKRVVDSILEMKGERFTAEALANQVGISRVSIRKYLKFLTGIGFVSIDLAYGTVGRPVYQYYVNEFNLDRIDPYL
ncbi:response regulator [Lihuaxuella thermophila]|uniref:Transcriptional regulatory protein n=1 Tax=Lihuaxuella thermophila TaxID=1173111 RepID=A0A1H8AM94_9BACL|nr:response regulator [Lihuaxuella thermophila]SEM70968.1 two-component system, CitB family, response regulator MalR [Lihuaxuella thermophila]